MKPFSHATYLTLLPCFALANPLIPSDILLSEKGSFDPSFTRIQIPLSRDGRGFFGADVNAFGSSYFNVWREIEIVGSPATSDPDDRPTLTFDSRTEFFAPASVRRDIKTEKVTFTDVKFESGYVRLFFQGDDNQLEINNSDLSFRSVSVPTPHLPIRGLFGLPGAIARSLTYLETTTRRSHWTSPPARTLP